MAIFQYKPANSQVFIGLAGDTKPPGTVNSGPQPGDKFLESDTSKLFVWTGTAWVQISAAAATAVYGTT